MQTEKNAADFGLYPEFFGIPDRLVALAEYMSYLHVESIHWAMETGERIRPRGLYAMVSDELNIDPDVLNDWVSCGEAIKWDRELQELTPEEREKRLADLESDPTEEELAEFEAFEAELRSKDPNYRSFDDHVAEAVAEAEKANAEMDLLNHLFYDQ